MDNLDELCRKWADDYRFQFIRQEAGFTEAQLISAMKELHDAGFITITEHRIQMRTPVVVYQK